MTPPRSAPAHLHSLREALLARWQERGERRALERLLAIEIGEIKRLLRGRTAARGAWSDASDFAQSAVRRLLERRELPHFASAGGLRAYLVRTARNRFYECLEAAGRTPEASSAGLAQSGGLGALERRDAIRDALPRLDPLEREVIDLQFFQGLSRGEVCERLGIAKQTASDRTLRALDHLKRILGR